MLATDAVKRIMEKQSVTHSMLKDRLGIKSNVLSQRFTQKNISVDKLHEMLQAMDYKIIVVPRGTRIPEGGIEITSTSTSTSTPDLTSGPASIEDQLKSGAITFDQAVAQGWKPSKEMLDKLLG